jgi:hypothetical protein
MPVKLDTFTAEPRALDISMKKKALHTDIGKGLGVEKYISAIM